MAKELPWFKFYCSEWLGGSITLESMAVQGLFINICALYWFKSGDLKTSEIKRRVKFNQANFKRLVDSDLLKVIEDDVKIDFLDEQMIKKQSNASQMSINGSKGGAPKGNFNARKAEKNNPKQPKTNYIEGDKKRVDIDKKDSSIIDIGNPKEKYFIIINSPYAGESKYRLYGVDGVEKFLEQSGSKWPRTDYAEKFLRDKSGLPFNDFGHVLNAYNLFIINQFK